MTAHNERYALVFNGEVYNFKELRDNLKSLGVQFRSTSDSEVVLYALIEWGTAALDRFNGMFALGFYDAVDKLLLLARDHAGIKPLYYLNRPQGVVFASQYNQLLTHPWSRDLGISNEALGLYLRLAYIPAPYGLLQDSHMLEPGSWLEVNADGRLRHGKYFAFPQNKKPSVEGRDAIEAVDAAVTQAVERQLVSDVPVGAFLSGGIDSPLVVAKMRSANNGSMRAFTIGTDGDQTDESADAIIYAREFGIEHTVEHINPDNAVELIDDVIEACGEPFGDYSMFPTILVSRIASREFKVMLSGDGGDELFWGYSNRFGPLMQAAQRVQHAGWLRRMRWNIQDLLSSVVLHNRLYRASSGELHRKMLTHLPEFCLRKVFPSLSPWPMDFEALSYTGWELDKTAHCARWNEFVYHLPWVLLKVDRASMYHSLEVRVPLLDRQVIDVATQIDWRECLDTVNMIGKIPLRRTLARHVNYQTEKKRGFVVPMRKWLRTSLRGMFETHVLQRDEILGLGIDRSALNALFNEHLSGQQDHSWGLWPLLSLALWVDKHFQLQS